MKEMSGAQSSYLQVIEQSIKSLEMIRDLDFDALVPWVSIEGESPVFFINDENDKQQRVQKIIDRVRNGENT